MSGGGRPRAVGDTRRALPAALQGAAAPWPNPWTSVDGVDGGDNVDDGNRGVEAGGVRAAPFVQVGEEP